MWHVIVLSFFVDTLKLLTDAHAVHDRPTHERF